MKKIVIFIFLCFSSIVYAQEICDNAIDDDGDGLIDLNDDDCECSGLGGIESLIPNPSFEDISCCPSNYSQLNCADEWINANIGTVDFFHTCDLWWDALFYRPPFPFPGDSDGCLGFLGGVECVGACLEETMVAGEVYILNMHIARHTGAFSFELFLYGTPNCDDLPWAVIGCPDGIDDWEVLGTTAVELDAHNEWTEVTLTFTPTVDISAIAISPDCDDAGAAGFIFVDELVLLSEDAFYEMDMEGTGGWCSGDLILTVETDTFGGYWQWYKDGIALLGETSPSLSPVPYGEGDFFAAYYIGSYCDVLTYQSPTHGMEAGFEVESFCYPDTSSFINTSTVIEGGGEVFYEWHFGDGEISFEESPDHVYDLPGDYDVMLIAKSSDSTCNDTIIQPYSVYPVPYTAIEVASEGMFTYVGTPTVCANSPVIFSDDTDLPPPYEVSSWFWDFGDGTTSTEPNPTHVYTDYGTVDVTLTVESATGCFDSETITLFVTALFPNFTVEDECVFDEVNFVNTSSAISPSVLESYEWHFDDGSTLTTTDADYTYTAPGTYPVELVVTSTSGCKDTIEQFVEVYPLPLAALEFIVDGVSSYDGGTGGCYTSLVQFNDSSTIDLPSFIDSWLWDFGDGTTSTEQFPEHLYDSEGTYTVTLTVSSDFGCEETITTDIIMTNGLAALSTDTTICQNGTATLLAESSDGGVYSYDWSIIGADDSPNQSLTGLTTSQWIYVTATNAAGCISPLDSVFIAVSDPVSATISPADTVCLGDPATINTVASGGNEVYNYSWTVDGDLIGEASATLTAYPTTTTEYCVTIADGCESDPVTLCTDVFVPELPVFIADNTQGCVPTEILFTDLTGPDTSLNSSKWYINSEVIYGNPASYLFEETGSYDVRLDVQSPEGCVSTLTIPACITIHPLPKPKFYATPNPTTYFNTEVTLVNIDPGPFATFQWHAPGGSPEWSNSDSLFKIVYPELVTGNYPVTLIETSEFGCVDSVSGTIVVNNDQIIYAPNTFTPDGDSFNETWRIYIEGIDIYDFHLTLFNRWGEIVWESYNAEASWDGTYGGATVKNGTYVWIIQAKDRENDKAYEFNGMVNVLR